MADEMNKILTDKILECIHDGIIIMDELRRIIKINPAAQRLGGWKIGEKVPYCEHCRRRIVREKEERCVFIANKKSTPYFSSKVQTCNGDKVDVEMSNVMIFHEKETKKKYYLVVLRDHTIKKKEEEARRSRQMLKQLTAAKEEEHKRLSHELHDHVGQSLYSISLALDNIIAKINDAVLHSYVKEVRSELGEVMEDIKAYSHALRPKSLDELGLISAIDSLVQSIKKNIPNTVCQLHYNFDDRLPPVIEINLYRAIQEALHNMMKYAKAKNVDIHLIKQGEQLVVKIMDDGVGFDPQMEGKGLGLLHIKERISQLQGYTEISSQPGKGTKITMAIPVKEGF